jgi:hypothetical protein
MAQGTPRHSRERLKACDQTSNVRLLARGWPAGWGGQLCLDYGEGARRLVEACHPLPSALADDFACKLDALTAIHRPFVSGVAVRG